MRSSNVASGLIGLALGLWLAYEGRELGLGHIREPGSGFVLFWIGIIMAFLSASLAVTALVRDRSPADAGIEADDGPRFGERWRNIPIVVGYLVIYAVLLETVGFIPLTILLLMLLFRTVDPQPWAVAIAYSVLATLTVYALFGIGLGTQFPAGVLDPAAIEWGFLDLQTPGNG